MARSIQLIILAVIFNCSTKAIADSSDAANYEKKQEQYCQRYRAPACDMHNDSNSAYLDESFEIACKAKLQAMGCEELASKVEDPSVLKSCKPDKICGGPNSGSYPPDMPWEDPELSKQCEANPKQLIDKYNKHKLVSDKFKITDKEVEKFLASPNCSQIQAVVKARGKAAIDDLNSRAKSGKDPAALAAIQNMGGSDPTGGAVDKCPGMVGDILFEQIIGPIKKQIEDHQLRNQCATNPEMKWKMIESYNNNELITGAFKIQDHEFRTFLTNRNCDQIQKVIIARATAALEDLNGRARSGKDPAALELIKKHQGNSRIDEFIGQAQPILACYTPAAKGELMCAIGVVAGANVAGGLTLAQATNILKKFGMSEKIEEWAKNRRIQANSKLDDAKRLENASLALGKTFEEKHTKALLKAHEVGKGQSGANGKPASVKNYTHAQISEKYRILREEGGFSEAEARFLMEEGYAGVAKDEPNLISWVRAKFGGGAKSEGATPAAVSGGKDPSEDLKRSLQAKGASESDIAIQMLKKGYVDQAKEMVLSSPSLQRDEMVMDALRRKKIDIDTEIKQRRDRRTIDYLVKNSSESTESTTKSLGVGVTSNVDSKTINETARREIARVERFNSSSTHMRDQNIEVALKAAEARVPVSTLDKPTDVYHASKQEVDKFDVNHNKDPSKVKNEVSSGSGIYTSSRVPLRSYGNNVYRFRIGAGTTVMSLDDPIVTSLVSAIQSSPMYFDELSKAAKAAAAAGKNPENAKRAFAIDRAWELLGKPDLIVGDLSIGGGAREVIIRNPGIAATAQRVQVP